MVLYAVDFVAAIANSAKVQFWWPDSRGKDSIEGLARLVVDNNNALNRL